MKSASWLRAASLVSLFFLFTVAGCAPATGKVKGRVKLVNKYLTAGTVGFVAKGGRVAVGQIDADGNYEIPDAPAGEVKISVQVPSALPGATVKPPPGIPDTRPKGGAAKPIVPIPAKYGNPETSGLTYTVQPGEQTHDITLAP